MKKLITALLCVCILLGVYGCAAKPATEDPAAQAKPTQTEQTPAADAQTLETSVQDETVDPFGGYDTPITLTTIVAQTLTTSCPEGVTLDDNPWKTLWNSKGIDVQYTSVAADFEDMPTKINLAITAGEFPDFASVSYATYKELLEADMLTDMTDIFEQYASDDLKKLMYADGGVMASNVTKDGRLYGLVQPADYLDKGGVVAIRTDWLQELGLSEPKSMADVWDIAAAFKENNMGGTCTIGLGATKEISDMLAMKYLINAEGGLVSTWLEQDGELVYSLIQPEMKTALLSLPLALSTVLVFWSPVNKNSWINGVFLLIMILAYYLSITAYCTPYNALIPELGHTQQERLNISTVISFTFIAGTAVAYLAPTIWGMFIPAFGRVGAIRMTFTLMAAVAFICMLVPVFCIREKDYVDTVPAKESAFGSLTATFKNGEFRKFVASDIFYWIALTMFQTGLPFFVTSLLKLPETMTTLYFVGMTALSLVFYIPVNKLTPKLGKKKMILFAFAVFSFAYFYTGFMGKISFIPASVQGLILTVVAALPMAIFGILPQAVVADISQSDSITSGSNREGMFYAARTFAFKLGQSISMLIFTAVSTIGAAEGTGYRVAAFGAAVFCCIGGIILVFYNEKKINGIINRHQ